jgi:hypothetical protein
MRVRRAANHQTNSGKTASFSVMEELPLWQLQIAEVAGHNLESRGREEVNRMLREGWQLLHVYTLKYREDCVWRERPRAILGKSRAKAEEILTAGSSRELQAPQGPASGKFQDLIASPRKLHLIGEKKERHEDRRRTAETQEQSEGEGR